MKMRRASVVEEEELIIPLDCKRNCTLKTKIILQLQYIGLV